MDFRRFSPEMDLVKEFIDPLRATLVCGEETGKTFPVVFCDEFSISCDTSAVRWEIGGS